jgi:hypothetical protein
MTPETADTASAATSPEGVGTGDEHVPYALELIFPGEEHIAGWECALPKGEQPLTWSGRCSTCRHEISVEVPEYVPAGLNLQAAAVPVSVQIRLFPCLCRGNHAARPEGVRYGCGRYWLGRVERFSDKRYTLSVETDVSKVARAEAIDAAVRSEDAWARTLAEKWVGGLVALLGILSVSSIVTGADAAKNVRADLRWLVFAAAVLALVSAALALFFAYRAAFGPAKFARLRDKSDEEKWLQQRRLAPRRTVRQLRISFALTLLSLLLAFVVASLLWFLPRGNPAHQCVVQGHGSCQIR